MICPDKNSEEDDNKMNVDSISGEINSGRREITTVISSLKDELTSSDQAKRAKAMGIISSVLERLDRTIATHDEVKCLTEYFTARLADKSQVVEETIPGLHVLSCFENFTFDMASSLLHAIQNDLATQTLKPNSKAQVYQLIYNLYAKFPEDFKALGSNFVYALLQIFDAETDPLSLEIIFQMYEKIVTVPEFEPHLEDIFDSLACYFPITPGKKDKYFEKKVKLSNLLTKAMAATAKFSPFVLSLAQEKFMTESTDAKLASYRLLEVALPLYKIEDVEKFLSKLWVCIRIDCLKPQIDDDDLAKQALETLKKLSTVVNQDQKVLQTWKEMIWSDLEISFRSPELELTNTSMEIVLAVAAANNDTLKYFIEKIEPNLLKHFLFNPDTRYQSLCLQAFLKLLGHCRCVNYPFDRDECFKQIESFMNNGAIKSDDVRRLIILILTEYAKISQLDRIYIRLVIDFAINCTRQTGYEMRFQEACFDLIATISKLEPKKIAQAYLDELIENYPYMVSYYSDRTSRLFYQNLVRHAAQEPEIASKVVKHLLSSTFILISLKGEHLDFCLNVLETFQILLNRFDSDFASLFHEDFIMRIYDTIVELHFTIPEALLSDQLMIQFAIVFDLYLRKINPDIRKSFADKILKTLITKNYANLLNKIVINRRVEMSFNNVSQIRTLLLFLFSCVRADSFSEPEDLTNVFRKVKDFCQSFFLSIQEHQYKNDIEWISSAIMAEIILKLGPCDPLLCEHLISTRSDLKLMTSTEEYKKWLLFNLIWICKSLFKMKQFSLVLKEYIKAIIEYRSVSRKYTEKLIDYIYNDIDYEIFKDEKIIPEFSPELHGFIREQFEANNEDDILQHLFLSHLNRMPVDEIQNLDNWSLFQVVSGLKASSNQRISMLLVRKFLDIQPAILEPQIAEILRLVIQVARNAEKMKDREEALDTVTMIIKVFGGKETIFNLKDEFITSLRPALADPKRIVRRNAVKAFCKLSMLGQPGSEKRIF